MNFGSNIFWEKKIFSFFYVSLKDNLKRYFSKKRHVATLVAIIILLIIIGLNNYLPVGPGNYNQKQIDKIHSFTPSDHFTFAVLGDNKNSFKIFKILFEKRRSKFNKLLSLMIAISK